MGAMHKHPASQPNMPAVERILARYDRESIEAFLEVALELLDTLDGDPDLEDDDAGEDDDPGGQCDEDGVNTASPSTSGTHDRHYYPGRLIYGVDQSAGPLNGQLVARRSDLRDQLADYERCGSPGSIEMARKVRQQLDRIDKRETDLIARATTDG